VVTTLPKVENLIDIKYMGMNPEKEHSPILSAFRFSVMHSSFKLQTHVHPPYCVTKQGGVTIRSAISKSVATQESNLQTPQTASLVLRFQAEMQIKTLHKQESREHQSMQFSILEDHKEPVVSHSTLAVTKCQALDVLLNFSLGNKGLHDSGASHVPKPGAFCHRTSNNGHRHDR
jgi:hypothetical protein